MPPQSCIHGWTYGKHWRTTQTIAAPSPHRALATQTWLTPCFLLCWPLRTYAIAKKQEFHFVEQAFLRSRVQPMCKQAVKDFPPSPWNRSVIKKHYYEFVNHLKICWSCRKIHYSWMIGDWQSKALTEVELASFTTGMEREKTRDWDKVASWHGIWKKR